MRGRGRVLALVLARVRVRVLALVLALVRVRVLVLVDMGAWKSQR